MSPKKKMQFFLRERRERRENIFTYYRGRTKNKKKRNRAPYLARANLPPPRLYYKKRWHSLYKSTPPRRQKRRPPPRRRPRSRRCARVSFARVVFRPDSDFFFRLSRPKWFCLLQREEKKRDQKTNQKSATFASSRLCAFAPKNRPFDAVKRAHRTPKCTGSTSVRALTLEHPSRAGREEDLSSGVCVFEKQKSKEICKVSFIEDASIAQKPTSLDDGKKTMREERFCFWSDFDLFFWSFRLKKEKKYTQTLTISFSFSFTQTLNNVL